MNNNRGIIWVIITILVIIVAIGVIFKGTSRGVINDYPVPSQSNNVDLNTSTSTSTYIGTYVCLPHRDTSGPTTMECAFGLQTENGSYYALDMSAVTIPADSINTGDKVRVEGTLVGQVELGNVWNIYNIVGGIKVTNINKLLPM